jgi:flagellar motor switch protein FliM
MTDSEQDEVNTGATSTESKEPSSLHKGSIDTYKMLAETSKIYERLPMLEVVLDRFSRKLVTSLRNFIRSNVEIDILSINSTRFGHFMEALPALSMMGIFKIAGTHPSAMFTVDAECISAVVDYLLGGRKTPLTERPESKGYTAIELELIKKQLNLMIADLQTAFSLVHSTAFELEVVETNPAFAFFTSARDAALIVRFRINVDNREGTFSLFIPYETLEPFKEKLLQSHTSENAHRDSKWKIHLEDELKQATLNLRVELAHFQSSLHKTLQWQVGTLIPLDVSSDALVKLFCGEKPLLSGRIGQKNKNIAIKIEENLLGHIFEIIPFLDEAG